MNAQRAASSLMIVVACIVPSLQHGHKGGYSGDYSGATAGSYAGSGGFGAGGSGGSIGDEIGQNILNEVGKGIQAIASGFAGAAAKAGSYGGGYGGGGGGGSYGGATAGSGAYAGGIGGPHKFPGGPGTSDIVVSVSGPDGGPQHGYGGGFGGAFAGGKHGVRGPGNGIILAEIDGGNIPAHLLGNLHNHGAPDGIVVTAIKKGSGPAVVTTTEIKNGKLVQRPSGLGCETGCNSGNPNYNQQPNYYPSGSGPVPVDSEKYTGPFPGPSGSIHDYQPSTGKGPGHGNQYPQNNQGQPNYPNDGNYNPTNDQKYTGPFPGPTGSIYDSKPVVPGSTPSGNYAPTRPGVNPQGEVSGATGGLLCVNGRCETSEDKYTGPFPGPIGSIHNSKPAHGGVPPGHGGIPPGHGGVPPGQGGVPPGHGGVPPGHGGVPPGQQNKYPNQPYPQDQQEQTSPTQGSSYNPINDEKYTGPFPGPPGSIHDFKPAPGKGTPNNNYPNQGPNTPYPEQRPAGVHPPPSSIPEKGCSEPGGSCFNNPSQPSPGKPVGCNGPIGSCSNPSQGNKCPYPGACDNAPNSPNAPAVVIVEEDCSKPGGCSFPHKFKPRPGYVCNSYGACTPQNPTVGPGNNNNQNKPSGPYKPGSNKPGPTGPNYGDQKRVEADYEDLQFGKPNHGGQNPQGPNYGGENQGPNHGGQNPNGPNYGDQQTGPNHGGQPSGPNHGKQPSNQNHGTQPSGPNYGGQSPEPNYGEQPNYGGQQPQQPNYGNQKPQQPNYGGQQPNQQSGGTHPTNQNPHSPAGTTCTGLQCLDVLGNQSPNDNKGSSGGYPAPPTNIQPPYTGGPTGGSTLHSGSPSEGDTSPGQTCQGLECLKHLPPGQDGDHIAQVPIIGDNTEKPNKPNNGKGSGPDCGGNLCGNTEGTGPLPGTVPDSDHSAITFDNSNEDGKYGGAGAFAGAGAYAGTGAHGGGGGGQVPVNVGDLARAGNGAYAGAGAGAYAGAGAAPFGKGFPAGVPGGAKGGSYSASYSSAASASSSGSYSASTHR